MTIFTEQLLLPTELCKGDKFKTLDSNNVYTVTRISNNGSVVSNDGLGNWFTFSYNYDGCLIKITQ